LELSKWGDLARRDAKHGGTRAKIDEGRGIGSRHPDLRTKFGQRVKQRTAALGVEMGGNFIEQNQGHQSAH
jgi:hypothetical protein